MATPLVMSDAQPLLIVEAAELRVSVLHVCVQAPPSQLLTANETEAEGEPEGCLAPRSHEFNLEVTYEA